jgi:hypothetical protein
MSNSLFAYIDPVSGVLLIQIVIGGCLGVVGFCRHTLWGALTQFVSRLSRASGELSEPVVSDESSVLPIRHLNDAGFATLSLKRPAFGQNREYRQEAA